MTITQILCRYLRNHYQYTMRELADELQVEYTAVWRNENKRVQLRYIEKLIERFGFYGPIQDHAKHIAIELLANGENAVKVMGALQLDCLVIRRSEDEPYFLLPG